MGDAVGWEWEFKRWQSRLLAKLVDAGSPRPLIRWAIRRMTALYRIDLGDSKKALEEFSSVNDFFTREMKDEARPIDRDAKTGVSPVDGTVQAFGDLKECRFLQAKGISYPLERLVPSPRAADFRDGFFLTIYLSPRDGHRIFSHCDGRVVASCHVPGLLYQVREPYVSEVDGLYALNERLITFLEADFGPTASVSVAALNVARITAAYDASIVTNRPCKGISEKKYEPKPALQRGQHLATFNLGSTVILLFPKGVVKESMKREGESVKYGQALLRLS